MTKTYKAKVVPTEDGWTFTLPDPLALYPGEQVTVVPTFDLGNPMGPPVKCEISVRRWSLPRRWWARFRKQPTTLIGVSYSL